MTAWANYPLTHTVLYVVPLDAAQTFSETCVEVETLVGDINTNEVHCVLPLGTDNDNRSTSAVSVKLISVAFAGEALSVGRIEGSAGRGSVEAGVVGLPLVSRTSHVFTSAGSIVKNEVDGVAAVEAGTSKCVEATAAWIDRKTASEVEVLSWWAGCIGEAGTILQNITRNAI